MANRAGPNDWLSAEPTSDDGHVAYRLNVNIVGGAGSYTGPLAAQLPATLGPKAAAAGLAVVPTGVAVTATATFTPTAASYTALDLIDVAKQLSFTYADGTAVPSGATIRILSASVKIDVSALQAGEAAYQVQLYTVTPPSAQADNAAWTLASADLPSYEGSVVVGTPVDLGAALFVKTSNINYDVKLAGTSLFAELQNQGTFTATAVARQIFVNAIIL